MMPRDIGAIRFYLDQHKRLRNRALFDLAIDSKLRGCDLVKIRTGDLMSAGSFVSARLLSSKKLAAPCDLRSCPRRAKEPESMARSARWGDP